MVVNNPPNPVTFHGEEFCIDKTLLRKPAPVKRAVKNAVLVSILGASAYYGHLGTVLKCGIGGLAGFLGLYTGAVLVGGKRVSALAMGYMIPRVMNNVDIVFKNIRLDLLKGLSGRVLDLGSGGGAYLEYCRQAAVSGNDIKHVVALEPNTNLHTRLWRKAKDLTEGHNYTIEVDGRFIQDVEGDGSFDWVILGNVLCEVPDPADILVHVNRLLKKGGRVYFCEHIAHQRGSFGNMMQNFLNPWWSLITDGCNCNRRNLELIKDQPWDVLDWTFADPFPGPMAVGIAVKK